MTRLPTLLLVCITLSGQADPRTKGLREYLKENFGMTSWYKAIKDARIDGDTAVAQVTAKAQAGAVCGAVSGYVYDKTSKHNLKSVKIVGPDNKEVLIDRRTIAQPCK